jgi:hypothetical protein
MRSLEMIVASLSQLILCLTDYTNLVVCVRGNNVIDIVQDVDLSVVGYRMLISV